MIEAVLFDWNNTLVQFEWDDELVEVGHRAGSAATTPRSRRAGARPMLGGRNGDRRYAEILRELGRRRLDASSTRSTRCGVRHTPCSASAQALLDSLRTRGLKTGAGRELVARPGACPARRRRGLRARGAARRASSSRRRSGCRSRTPRSSCTRCDKLSVEAGATMFVGDGSSTDVQGAAAGGHDYAFRRCGSEQTTLPGSRRTSMAFTPMDVLNAVAAPRLVSAESQVLRPSATVRTMSV